MAVNFVLLDKALDAIANDPSRWNQGDWVCKPNAYTTDLCQTTLCLAGWTLLATNEYIVANKKTYDQFYQDNYLSPWFFNILEGEFLPKDVDAETSLYSVATKAGELLGIDPRLANELFYNSSHEFAADTDPSPEDFRLWVYKTIAKHYSTLVSDAEKSDALARELSSQSNAWDAEAPF